MAAEANWKKQKRTLLTGCPIPCARGPRVGLTLIWVLHPSCPAASDKFPSAQAELGRQWNTLNSSQPNPVHEHIGRPVTLEDGLGPTGFYAGNASILNVDKYPQDVSFTDIKSFWTT